MVKFIGDLVAGDLVVDRYDTVYEFVRFEAVRDAVVIHPINGKEFSISLYEICPVDKKPTGHSVRRFKVGRQSEVTKFCELLDSNDAQLRGVELLDDRLLRTEWEITYYHNNDIEMEVLC